MLNRRAFCGCASLALVSGLVATRAEAQPASCAVMTRDSQRAMSPAEALDRLKAGNVRFVGGETVNCDLMRQGSRDGRRGRRRSRRWSGASIPACRPNGVRSAHRRYFLRADRREISSMPISSASLSFATRLAGARAIVVLGHSNCGAIKGAIDNCETRPSDGDAGPHPPGGEGGQGGRRTQREERGLRSGGRGSQCPRRLSTGWPPGGKVLSQLVAAGELRIVGAMHDLRQRQDRLARLKAFPLSDGIRSGLYLYVLTRFLHANRHPLRSKTL